MALMIGTPYTGNGTPFFLAAGVNFVLQPNIVIYDLDTFFDSYAVSTDTGGHSFTIYGTIIGYRGIRMGNSGDDFGNNLFIGTTGSVSGYGAAAVTVLGGQATVVNQGLITGVFGVAFSSGLGTGSSLTNGGQIITDDAAVFAGGNEKINLVNTGTITSYISHSFRGNTGADVVGNQGTMNGNVDLKENNDTYEGNGGKVNGTILGGVGNDSLRGGAFLDRMNGGANNDFLTGRGGRDDLMGGTENDQFIYTAITDSGITAATRDLIRDFNIGNDVFNLSLIDANTSIADNQAFGLLARGNATSAVGAGKIGWYWIDSTTSDALDRTILRINNDADVAIEMTIELVGLKTLSATAGVDFIF